MKKQRSSKILALAASFLISAGILGALFYQIEWDAFTGALKQIRIPWLLAVAVLAVVCFAIRSLRWRYLLPDSHSWPFSTLFDATSLGFMATSVLPLRAGEVVRPLFAAKWEERPFGQVFASIVTERIFDVLSLLAFLAFSLSSVTELPDFARLAIHALLIMTGVLFAVVIVAYFRRSWVLGMASRVLTATLPERYASTLYGFVAHVLDGLCGVSRFQELLIIVILSALMWGLTALGFACGLLAFGLPFSFLEGCLVMVFVGLAVAAPSAPGFLGPFQLGCAFALTTLRGHSMAMATAYGLVINVTHVLICVALGCFSLNRRGLSFSQTVTSAEAPA